MNYSYFVTWCLVIQLSGLSYIEYDYFERAIGWHTETYDSYDCMHIKYFNTKEDADEFVFMANNETDVINVKLDSTEVLDNFYDIDTCIFDSVWSEIYVDTLWYPQQIE